MTSHFFSDTWRVLERLHERGYRRPGPVLGHYEEVRSTSACSGAYLGWCEQRFGPTVALPILRMQRVEEAPLLAWLREQRPDVLIFAHVSNTLPEFQAVLRAHRIRVPKDLSVVAITQILGGTDLSGMQQNHQIMGARLVELLAALIMNLDIGFPTHPRIEMVGFKSRAICSVMARMSAW